MYDDYHTIKKIKCFFFIFDMPKFYEVNYKKYLNYYF